MEKRGALTLHGRHPKTGQTFRETIEPHPDFRWMSTANTIGLGDDAFLYHGTTFMNAAARDRYEAILKMDYPTPDIESEILALKVQSPTGENLSSETIERMIKIANGVRENFKSRSCNFAFTIRRTISWGNYWLRKGPAEGSKLALLNFASLNDRITLRGLIESELAIHIEED